jgi:glycosyltransferase involved in cell wall biosynthesis
MISVYIICFNEEENIRDCLESVKWADEIIVVDADSTDKTVEICKDYTDKVFIHPFSDYCSQKNLALSKCSGEWVLSIDADERVTDELAEEIKGVVLEKKWSGYLIPRKSYYLNRWIRYSNWYPDAKLRLAKRGLCRWEGEGLHERLVVEGRVRRLKSELLHYSYRSISEHIKRMDRYTEISAEEMKRKGRRFRLLDLTFRPLWNFFKHYFIKLGFLDGVPGFVIAAMAFYHTFLKYIKLYEIERSELT